MSPVRRLLACLAYLLLTPPRYCRGAAPLVVSTLAAPMAAPPPPCPCGAARIPELQLLSTALASLRPARGDPGAADFATAVLFTCSAACGGAVRREHVWWQADPDHVPDVEK